MNRQSSREMYEGIATGLGWFSIGLGAAEVIAPGSVARMAGIRTGPGSQKIIRSRLYGMREIAAGAGILSQNQRAPWLWSRVAGDLIDIATLAGALASGRNDRKRVAYSLAAVAGITALDVVTAQELSRTGFSAANGSALQTLRMKSITVNKPVEEVYAFWRNFENFPSFMPHLESVRSTGDRRTLWRARGPMGRIVEWEAEITEERPNECIAWHSLEGSDVANSGSVRFERAPMDRGTVVRVQIRYTPPAGRFGATVAKLWGNDPEQMLDRDLRTFKQIMETGEVVHSDASIHRGAHAAQPPELAGARS
ncbi:MAG: SRPBCC family protein [Bryobacteraceae bacterium]|nr:SRPBCC family protein [Bryobacteraceae bacterium]